MPHLSKRSVDKKFDRLLDKTLFDVLAEPNSASHLTSLLTSTEIKMIKKRLGIYMLLDAGYTMEKVSTATKTTLQTIIRYRSVLAKTNTKSRKQLLSILRKAYTKHSFKSLLNNLLDINISRSSFKKRISPF